MPPKTKKPAPAAAPAAKPAEKPKAAEKPKEAPATKPKPSPPAKPKAAAGGQVKSTKRTPRQRQLQSARDRAAAAAAKVKKGNFTKRHRKVRASQHVFRRHLELIACL